MITPPKHCQSSTLQSINGHNNNKHIVTRHYQSARTFLEALIIHNINKQISAKN